jgi:hypothetical protein
MKKQELKTIDITVVLILMAFSMSLSWKLVSAGEGHPDMRKAQNDTKNLSLQLMSGGLGSLQEEEVEPSRGPASVSADLAYKKSLELFGKSGKLSLDPWGHPYRYTFIENSNDVGQNETLVLVWSDGPNGKSETEMESLGHLKLNESSNLAKILNGDDIGYIRGTNEAKPIR